MYDGKGVETAVYILWGYAIVRHSLHRIRIIHRLSLVVCNVTLCRNGEIEYSTHLIFLFRVEKGIWIGLSADIHSQTLRRLSSYGLGRENRGLERLIYLWCGTFENNQLFPALLSVLLYGIVVIIETVVWYPGRGSVVSGKIFKFLGFTFWILLFYLLWFRSFIEPAKRLRFRKWQGEKQ